MQVVYSQEATPAVVYASVFLAGPSPRRLGDADWRTEAIAALAAAGFTGVVYAPVPRDGAWPEDYGQQVDWETRALHRADVVWFHVPRDLRVVEAVPAGASAERAMARPGFTTNVEFGLWLGSGKCVLTCPPDAPTTRYLQHHAAQAAVPVGVTLAEGAALVVARTGAGAARQGGARDVPLHIWRTPHFQGWYQAQVGAGNRLDGAQVLWRFGVGPQQGFCFAFALKVDVHVAAEGRNKTNEFIVARPDVAAVVAWHRPHPGAALVDHTVVLIREFRSPGRTADGFIRELPGGSTPTPGEDPRETMRQELAEETGLGPDQGFHVAPERVRPLGTRQLAGTLSVHQAHVFAVELTDAEHDFLATQAAAGVAHGVVGSSERTYVALCRVGDLLAPDSGLDWSTLGMVLSAVESDLRRSAAPRS